MGGTPLYLYNMVNKIRHPPEIVKVRAERDTIICRIPRWYAQEHKLTSNSYIVFRDKLGAKLELVLFEDHIYGKR